MWLPPYKTDQLTITLCAPYASLVPELQPPFWYCKPESLLSIPLQLQEQEQE